MGRTKRIVMKRKKLKPGQCILSQTAPYEVVDILGSGGFGDVKRLKADGSPEFALKTEFFDPNKKKCLDRLKVEMGVFLEISQSKDFKAFQHFIEMADKGRTEEFKFIVMPIVGNSIETIRREIIQGNLKPASVIRIGLQTLEAIRDIHKIGFLHRDVKPHNFAVGLAPNENIIYMLDFGIARRYREKDGRLRIPREEVKFLGTVKFASRACHHAKEQSRKDDLESWIFMILDLLHPANLTWRREFDRKMVTAMKEELFRKTDDVKLKCPAEVIACVRHIGGLGFADDPDYEYLGDCLTRGAMREKLDLQAPFEWIGLGSAKKKKKKKTDANKLQDDENDDSEERRRREVKAAERAKKPPTSEDQDDDEDEEVEEEKVKKFSKKSVSRSRLMTAKFVIKSPVTPTPTARSNEKSRKKVQPPSSSQKSSDPSSENNKD